jgi:phage/plasmid primase-like uncharacterized protein
MNVSPRRSADFEVWIDGARAVPIEQEIDRRGIRLKGRNEKVGPCPVCGGTDRFSVNVAKGLWNCRRCNKGGDVIELVRHLDGCDFLIAVGTLTGEKRPDNNPGHRPDPERERQLALQREHHARERDRHAEQERQDAERQFQRAEQTWQEASPTLGPPAIDYLARRGISLDDVPESGGLRWHPACPWELGTKSCVVARYTDIVTGEPRGIWRRPITGEKPMSLGPMGGCVIKLWTDDAVNEGLVIGEGIETTLAAATRIEHRETLLQPAWATGSAGNMATFPVLAGIEALTILVDNDASGTGQKAAEACAQRWRDAGKEVVRLMPGDLGADFNNLVTP